MKFRGFIYDRLVVGLLAGFTVVFILMTLLLEPVLALAEFVIVEGFLHNLFFIIEGPGLVAAVTIVVSLIDTFPVGNELGMLPPLGCGITDAFVSSDAGVTACNAPDQTAGSRNNIFHDHSSQRPNIRFALPKQICS